MMASSFTIVRSYKQQTNNSWEINLLSLWSFDYYKLRRSLSSEHSNDISLTKRFTLVFRRPSLGFVDNRHVTQLGPKSLDRSTQYGDICANFHRFRILYITLQQHKNIITRWTRCSVSTPWHKQSLSKWRKTSAFERNYRALYNAGTERVSPGGGGREGARGRYGGVVRGRI